jgi:hypothetical protein
LGFENWAQTTVGLIIIALLLVFAMLLTPVFLIGVPAYIGLRLYQENPARLERLARAQTMTLYSHALAGTVQLTPDQIDTALSHTWPLDTPDAVKVQLLATGRALFADEGLSPDVPPPPALCNTVEGARYRDAVARIGQARGDRRKPQRDRPRRASS